MPAKKGVDLSETALSDVRTVQSDLNFRQQERIQSALAKSFEHFELRPLDVELDEIEDRFAALVEDLFEPAGFDRGLGARKEIGIGGIRSDDRLVRGQD